MRASRSSFVQETHCCKLCLAGSSASSRTALLSIRPNIHTVSRQWSNECVSYRSNPTMTNSYEPLNPSESHQHFRSRIAPETDADHEPRLPTGLERNRTPGLHLWIRAARRKTRLLATFLLFSSFWHEERNAVLRRLASVRRVDIKSLCRVDGGRERGGGGRGRWKRSKMNINTNTRCGYKTRLVTRSIGESNPGSGELRFSMFRAADA